MNETCVDRKPDRRIRRSRMLLSQAFVALLLEKWYDAITVQDIVDRANVGRSTFYAHFRDKEDLLRHSFEDMLAGLSRDLQAQDRDAPGPLPVEGLFRHVQSHRDLYRALLWTRGLEVISKAGQEFFEQWIEDRLMARGLSGPSSPVPPPIAAACLAGALLSLVRWWLDDNMPYSPEQMATYFSEMMPAAVPTGTAGPA